MRASFGTSSFISSTRFAARSFAKVLRPVTFPPGRDKLATTRSGSPSANITMGISPVAALAARVARRPPRQNQIDLELHQLGSERREALGATVTMTVFDGEITPLDVSELAHAAQENAEIFRVRGRGPDLQNANPPHPL